MNRNVIIAMFDTLAPRYLKQWGGEIDFFGTDDVIAVTNCWTAETVTLPSVASMFTGVYPEKHGICSHWRRRIARLRAGTPTLPESLEAMGYRNFLAVTDYFGHDMYRLKGLAKGFHHYWPIKSSCSKKVWTNALDTLAERLASDRKENGLQPFFAFIHHFFNHIPYGQPASVGGWCNFIWRAEITVEQAYRQRVQTVAENIIPDLLNFAIDHDADLWIVSDHGEVFASETESGHAEWLEPDNARVVCALLNSGERREVKGLFSLIDLATTVLSRVSGKPLGDGRDMLKDAGRDHVVVINEQAAKTKMAAKVYPDGLMEYTRCEIDGEKMSAREEEMTVKRLQALGYIEGDWK